MGPGLRPVFRTWKLFQILETRPLRSLLVPSQETVLQGEENRFTRSFFRHLEVQPGRPPNRLKLGVFSDAAVLAAKLSPQTAKNVRPNPAFGSNLWDQRAS